MKSSTVSVNLRFPISAPLPRPRIPPSRNISVNIVPPRAMSVAFKHTCVFVNDGDGGSGVALKLWALASLVPYISAVSFLTASCLSARNASFYLLLLMGMLLVEVTCVLLKHAIAQPRPLSCPDTQFGSCKSHGMPSSHAMSCTFVAVCMVLYAKTNKTGDDLLKNQAVAKTKRRLERLCRAVLAVVACCVAFACCASRVVLRYHHATQVMVGALLGTLFALTYFPTTRAFGRVFHTDSRVLRGVDALARIVAGALSGSSFATTKSVVHSWWHDAWAWTAL